MRVLIALLAACLFLFSTVDGYALALAVVWNSLMHAIHGNIGLQALLVSKGVPESRAHDRAADTNRVCGKAAVSKALSSDDPWAALLSLAKAKQHRLVQQGELKER